MSRNRNLIVLLCAWMAVLCAFGQGSLYSVTVESGSTKAIDYAGMGGGGHDRDRPRHPRRTHAEVARRLRNPPIVKG